MTSKDHHMTLDPIEADQTRAEAALKAIEYTPEERAAASDPDSPVKLAPGHPLALRLAPLYAAVA